jgi:hypothetical protein
MRAATPHSEHLSFLADDEPISGKLDFSVSNCDLWGLWRVWHFSVFFHFWGVHVSRPIPIGTFGQGGACSVPSRGHPCSFWASLASPVTNYGRANMGPGQVLVGFGQTGHEAQNTTFLSEKPYVAKVIGYGPGMVWAQFGSANRVSRLCLILPGLSIAWKSRDAWDQKQAETGSKKTLFKSDRGGSGGTVGVFWDSGSVVIRGLDPVTPQKGMEKHQRACRKWVEKGVKMTFSKGDM